MDLLAFVLLAGPLEVPPGFVYASSDLVAAFDRASSGLEVSFKPCDTSSFSSFASDYRWRREVYRDVRDCPSLCWSQVFPPHHLLLECWDFNLRCQTYFSRGASYYRGQPEVWLKAAAECERLRGYYRLAADARDPTGEVSWRRKKLRELRELLGDQAFRLGELPPCVPLWAFKELP